MEVKYTGRGFAVAEFKDSKDQECSIQESSIAGDACIWLGIDDVEVIDYAGTPKVIELKKLGGDVRAMGRMHLTQKQVAELLPLLNMFVQTGLLTNEEQ